MEAFSRKAKRMPLGRPIRRLEDNFKVDLGVIRWGVTDWSNLAQDRDQ
jgi:hypothetical protein